MADLMRRGYDDACDIKPAAGERGGDVPNSMTLSATVCLMGAACSAR